MRVLVRYRRPVTGHSYFFKDFECHTDSVRPVGCFSTGYQRAKLFNSISSAMPVVNQLLDLGFYVSLVRVFKADVPCGYRFATVRSFVGG